MDEQTLRNVRNVLAMVMQDGQISPQEQTHLDSLRSKAGIDEETFNEIVRQVRQEPNRLSIAKGPEGVSTLDMLIEAAHADGELHEKEKHVLEKVADYLGVERAELQRRLPVDEEKATRIENELETVYTHFADWSPDERQEQIEQIARQGADAVIPLLRVMESYRTPDGCETNLPLKQLVARQLGRLGDERAVYYLAQQVSLGDLEDETTGPALRRGCAEAIGSILDTDFGTGDDAVQRVREWWKGPGRQKHTHLAL